jgi:hypothetical protein
MDMDAAKALYEQGLVSEQDVVDAAVAALVDGMDSPSLRILAGLIPADYDRVRELLPRVGTELDLPERDRLSAVMALARSKAERALAGQLAISDAIEWIAYQTWFAYSESPAFEEDPKQRPPEVQRMINQIELADLLRKSSDPRWLRERLLTDAEAVLRAVVGLSDWPEPTAWEGVEWTGSSYRLRE